MRMQKLRLTCTKRSFHTTEATRLSKGLHPKLKRPLHQPYRTMPPGLGTEFADSQMEAEDIVEDRPVAAVPPVNCDFKNDSVASQYIMLGRPRLRGPLPQYIPDTRLRVVTG